jgi:hypothetical protein
VPHDRGQGRAGGFPASDAQCKTCHPESVERFAKLPFRRVYKLPDFIFFSHARHVTAKVECKTCHGEVAAQDLVQLEIKPTMKSCVDCHKANQATIVCTACHELNQ